MQSKTLEIKGNGFVPQPQTGENGAPPERLNNSHGEGDYHLSLVALSHGPEKKAAPDWSRAVGLFFPHSCVKCWSENDLQMLPRELRPELHQRDCQVHKLKYGLDYNELHGEPQ